MAPEIFAGKGYSYEIDLWALGCIIYELIIGDIPFGNKILLLIEDIFFI